MSTVPTLSPQRRTRESGDDDDVNNNNNQQQPQQQQPPQQQQQERNPRHKNDSTIGCGLTLFEAISSHAASSASSSPPPRFSAVLKERYSDFIVREMAPRPLSLTNLQVDEACRDPPPPKQEVYAPPSVEKVKELLGTIITEEDMSVLCGALTADPQPANCVLPTPRTEKLERAKIHQLIKQCGFPDSGTNNEGKISVAVAPAAGRGGAAAFAGRGRGGSSYHGTGGGRGGGRGGGGDLRSYWPKNRGEYLHFTLYKENIESGAALRQIASKMGVPLRVLAYCGNKDKRAVTTQRVAGRFLSAEKLAGINGMSFGRSSLVRVGDFEYRSDSLAIGKLNGNGFSIVLRRVPKSEVASAEVVQAFENSLRQNGFANYFGPQRFGTTSIPSCDVGRALIVGDYEKTLLLVLSSKVEICPDFAPALEAFKRRDIAAAVKAAPYHCTFERDALIALNQNPNEYQQAVMALPRPLTMLYCHSVQSLVWNTMVAHRLKEAPYVLEGDLVLMALPSSDASAAAAAAAVGGSNSSDAEMLVQDGGDDGGAGAGVGDDAAAGNNNSGPLPAVKFVTADDVANNRYALSDVLLPIPGPDPDLQFPQCSVSNRDAYVKCMNDLGIGDSLLKVQKFIEKRFHIHGGYRPVAVVPANLSLRLQGYDNNDELLLETDWSRISAQKKKSSENIIDAEKKSPAEQEQQQHYQQQYQQQAVIAEFELPAGSYATSVLREMCECVHDTRSLGV